MKNKNRVIIILSAIFVLAALIFLILGFTLAGVNVLAWFTSTQAYIFYIFAGLYVLTIIFIIVGDYIKRL